MAITAGIKGEKKFAVNEDMLASRVGSGLVNVFATPCMIAGIENTAAMSVQPELEEGKTTVGIATEVAPNGKVMTFKVTGYDEAGLIGEGTHQRAIVDRARFEARANAKGAK